MLFFPEEHEPVCCLSGMLYFPVSFSQSGAVCCTLLRSSCRLLATIPFRLLREALDTRKGRPEGMRGGNRVCFVTAPTDAPMDMKDLRQIKIQHSYKNSRVKYCKKEEDC